MRFLGGAALVAATVLALTGCGSQATRSSATPSVTVAPSTVSATPTPTPTETVAETVAPTSTPTAPPVSAADPNAPANQCATRDLGVQVVVADGGGGAGNEYYDVLFTNTGGGSCALRGTPGVSVVGNGTGTQLGAAAERIETGVKTLTLAVGETVAAPLKVVNIGTDGGPLDGCTVKQGDGYRVYPPHSTKSVFVADTKSVACSPGPSFMTVGPVVRRTD